MSVVTFLSSFSVPNIGRIYKELRVPFVQKTRKEKLVSLAVTNGVTMEEIEKVLRNIPSIRPITNKSTSMETVEIVIEEQPEVTMDETSKTIPLGFVQISDQIVADEMGRMRECIYGTVEDSDRLVASIFDLSPVNVDGKTPRMPASLDGMHFYSATDKFSHTFEISDQGTATDEKIGEIRLDYRPSLERFLNYLRRDTNISSSFSNKEGKYSKILSSNPYYLVPIGILAAHVKSYGSILQDMEVNALKLECVFPKIKEEIFKAATNLFSKDDSLSREDQLKVIILNAAFRGLNLRSRRMEMMISHLDKCISDAILSLRGKSDIIPNFNYHLNILLCVIGWGSRVRKITSEGRLRYYLEIGEGFSNGEIPVADTATIRLIDSYVLSVLLKDSEHYELVSEHVNLSNIIDLFTIGLDRGITNRIHRNAIKKIIGTQLSLKDSKIEEYLFLRHIHSVGVNVLAPKIGMIIPEELDCNQYYDANILDYNDVAERRSPPFLSGKKYSTSQLGKIYPCYKDNEIFLSLGAIVPYSSRKQLLESSLALHSGSVLFFRPSQYSEKECKNRRTTMLEELRELEVGSLVAWGNLRDHTIFTFDELLKSFHSRRGSFLDPQSEGSIHLWSKNEISQLLILRGVPLELKIFIRDIISEDGKISSTLKGFSEKSKNLLTQVLNLGMFIRGWSGEYPYPLSSYIPSIPSHVDEMCEKAMANIFNIMNSIDQAEKKKFLDLKIVDAKDGYTEETILPLVESLKKGGCAKDISLKIIRSAHHYMVKIFGEIPFEIASLK